MKQRPDQQNFEGFWAWGNSWDWRIGISGHNLEQLNPPVGEIVHAFPNEKSRPPTDQEYHSKA